MLSLWPIPGKAIYLNSLLEGSPEDEASDTSKSVDTDLGHVERVELARCVDNQAITCCQNQIIKHKHNFHHSFPNRLEIDGDIHNEPILHLFFPDKEKESWNRKY